MVATVTISRGELAKRHPNSRSMAQPMRSESTRPQTTEGRYGQWKPVSSTTASDAPTAPMATWAKLTIRNAR